MWLRYFAGQTSDSQPSILDRFLKDAAATARKSEASVCETDPTRPLSSYTYESDSPIFGPPTHVHKFVVQTFSTPKKCIACSSLMVGLMRQGYICGGMFISPFRKHLTRPKSKCKWIVHCSVWNLLSHPLWQPSAEPVSTSSEPRFIFSLPFISSTLHYFYRLIVWFRTIIPIFQPVHSETTTGDRSQKRRRHGLRRISPSKFSSWENFWPFLSSQRRIFDKIYSIFLTLDLSSFLGSQSRRRQKGLAAFIRRRLRLQTLPLRTPPRGKELAGRCGRQPSSGHAGRRLCRIRCVGGRRDTRQ